MTDLCEGCGLPLPNAAGAGLYCPGCGEPVAAPARKPHVIIEQHYYYDYILEYGPTSMHDLALTFDVSLTTAQYKLKGLVSQGKLKVVREERPQMYSVYGIPGRDD